ncbi:MAG: phage tail tape measure protein [Bacteroidales bacterium]|nr:phage tail tape measure protein [Bacteroidales bacterium]
MSEQSINYIINLTGNALNSTFTLSKAINGLNDNVQKSAKIFNNLSGKIVVFNQLGQFAESLSVSFSDLTRSGLNFQQSIADLSSITGIAGKDLQSLTEKAREFGKASGLGASGIAESYKILASQIEVSSIGMEGLNKLQQATITLSQASGLDMQTSALAVAGTINQFGLEAGEATRVINVLAAGSKYGAAEIGDLSQSFKVSGATAHSAGLSVEQTAGALEVLSKNNLMGAEAGTALRNIVLKLQTDLNYDFTKTSLTLALEDLKPKLHDATYLSKLFGLENISAAQFLISNAQAVEEMTTKVTNTNVATEQAAIRTATYAEQLKRIKANIEDFKISVFNATGAIVPWVSALGEALTPLSRLVPLMAAIGKGAYWMFVNFMPGINLLKGGFTSVIAWVTRMGTVLKFQMAFMRADLAATSMASIGFRGNMIRAMLATINFGTKGIWSAIKGLGALIASFFTTGAASVSFAAVARASFGAFKTAAVGACRAVGVAIKNIPIIGWIAALVAAVISAISYFKLFKNKHKESNDTFRESARIGSEYYAKEKANLDVLFEKLKRTNPKSKERNDLVNQLKEMYPDLNKQILDEITNTNNLGTAYDIIIEKIKRNAMAKYRAAKVDASYSEMGTIEDNLKEEIRGIKNKNMQAVALMGYMKAGTTLDQQIDAFMTDFKKNPDDFKDHDIAKDFVDDYKNAVYNSEQSVKELADLQGGSANNGGGGNGGGSKTVTPEYASDAITGGGKSMKQVIINLNSGLIETNNNYFDKTQDPKDASDFMSKLTNALASVVNDVNYSV